MEVSADLSADPVEAAKKLKLTKEDVAYILAVAKGDTQYLTTSVKPTRFKGKIYRGVVSEQYFKDEEQNNPEAYKFWTTEHSVAKAFGPYVVSVSYDDDAWPVAKWLKENHQRLATLKDHYWSTGETLGDVHDSFDDFGVQPLGDLISDALGFNVTEPGAILVWSGNIKNPKVVEAGIAPHAEGCDIILYDLNDESRCTCGGGKLMVEAGMLDFPRKKLPASVWLYEAEQPLPRLQPKLRATILSEARYRLKKFGAKLKGAMLYGGASTYQYHEGGDIDVSLYIDWNDFNGDEEILDDAFKNVTIPWDKYELHLFVKPSNQQEQVEVADAFYDVVRDEWVLPPIVMPKGFDPDTFFGPMTEMAEKKAAQIDIQMGEVGREWMRLKKALRALKEGARDEHVVREKAEVTKGVLLDKIETLCDTFVGIWKARRKLHDELRIQLVRDRTIGRFERFQFPEVCWKYLDEMGYVEFLKVLAKANEAGVVKKLLDSTLPED